MTDVWGMIEAQRRGLADVLDGLTEQQWATQSLCSGWTVRNVAAHLLFPLETSLVAVLPKLVMSGFNFNKMTDKAAKGDRRPGAELAKALRSKADHRFKPPGFGPEAPLTDLVVHGQDICRPLGIDRAVPTDDARVVLDFLMIPKAAKAFGAKGASDGVRLVATDLEWHHGSGPEVRGPAVALALALTGRRGALADLTGEGVPTVGGRLR